MSFQKMKDALQSEGWYVAWAHSCCQTCAWHEVPSEHTDGPRQGQEIDYDKLLFNHEQDCQMDCEYDEENDEYILPEGMTRDDYSVFPTHKPDEIQGSLFCFSGNETGVKNLVDAIPIIESSGCKVDWNKKANTRIYIRWE